VRERGRTIDPTDYLERLRTEGAAAPDSDSAATRPRTGVVATVDDRDASP